MHAGFASQIPVRCETPWNSSPEGSGRWPPPQREDLGHALAQTGEKDDAIAAFEAAYDAYLIANATRDLARVRHALGVCKRRAAIARPGHGWGSLTSGEMAVVEVVAQGLTNRETAAQLYLSADTVNSHLWHAFAKLGIRSRVELARIAANRERTPV